MEYNLQSVHFDADIKLIDFIEKKLNKLETFHDKIISADVILKMENNEQIKDKIVEIKLNMPGTVLVSKENCKTFEESVDLVCDALRKQILKFKEKIREY
jgi:putative sigma-54 modulation protein